MTIYVRTHGGLGNQLFQMSFGLEASQKNNTNLILDTSWFKSIPEQSTKRVEYFSTLFPELLLFDDLNQTMLDLKSKSSFLQKFGIKKIHIKEKYGNYYSKYFNHKHAYFDGYWHSYKYLSNNLLSKTLRLNTIKGSLIEKYQRKIKEVNSVMLHVRRGDYLQNTNQNIVLNKSYYDEGIQHILKQERSIELYIFSDDMEWVKNNWKFDVPTNYVSSNSTEDTSIEELCLMANCKHHIIANSTFSWWGAWLGHKSEQIVITPKYWLEGNSQITANLTPPSWHLI